MDISALKKRKKELNITNEKLSEMSGIPKRTIEDIFRGATKHPRIDTMKAIERALGLDEPAPELTEEQKVLYDFIVSLTPEETKELSAIVDYIIRKRKE